MPGTFFGAIAATACMVALAARLALHPARSHANDEAMVACTGLSAFVAIVCLVLSSSAW